jgi:transposase
MKTIIEARAVASRGQCPDCGAISAHVHSRYQRRLADLPLAGRVVHMSLTARRFRCMTASCRRRIFTERFGDDILAPHARRTARLDVLVHHLALALGGRPAAGLARRLRMPVSNDTLLRVVRRYGRPSPPAPNVIGIDDWAWKRNQRYGAIICDLERRRPIKLLPDREPATAQAWLAESHKSL